MKTTYKPKLFHGKVQKLERLAERIESAASAVRYAVKPYDLEFPVTNLIDLVNQVKELEMEWLEKEFGLDPLNRGRYPPL